MFFKSLAKDSSAVYDLISIPVLLDPVIRLCTSGLERCLRSDILCLGTKQSVSVQLRLQSGLLQVVKTWYCNGWITRRSKHLIRFVDTCR